MEEIPILFHELDVISCKDVRKIDQLDFRPIKAFGGRRLMRQMLTKNEADVDQFLQHLKSIAFLLCNALNHMHCRT